MSPTRYVQHPSEIAGVGDAFEVTVMGVNVAEERVKPRLTRSSIDLYSNYDSFTKWARQCLRWCEKESVSDLLQKISMALKGYCESRTSVSNEPSTALPQFFVKASRYRSRYWNWDSNGSFSGSECGRLNRHMPKSSVHRSGSAKQSKDASSNWMSAKRSWRSATACAASAR